MEYHFIVFYMAVLPSKDAIRVPKVNACGWYEILTTGMPPEPVYGATVSTGDRIGSAMTIGALCGRGFRFAVVAVGFASCSVFCRPRADCPAPGSESSCANGPSLAWSLSGRHRRSFRACLATSRRGGDDAVGAREGDFGHASAYGDARRAALPCGEICDVFCLYYECDSCGSSGAASPGHHDAGAVPCLLCRASYPHFALAPCAACLLLPSWHQSVSSQEAAGQGLWPGRPPRPL